MRCWIILGVLAPSSVAVAQSVDVGSFSKSTNTSVPATQVVSHSLGETPKLVILWTANATGTAAEAFWGFGASDGSNEYSVSTFFENGVSPTDNTRRIATKVITQVDNAQAVLFEADLTSWNTTTFTLSWSTNNASAVTIHYIAIGGSGVSADVMNWSTPTGTGNHSETGVGFQPDVVMTVGLGGHTVAPSSSSNGGAFILGVMDASGDQWATAYFSTDNQEDSVNARAQRTNRCFLLVDNSPSIVTQASFVSMDADGFTMNFTSNFGFAVQLFSISLAGVNVEAGSFDKITSGSSQSVTTTLRDPELLLLSSWQRTASTSAQTQTSFAFGASDGTDEGVAGIFDEDASDPADTDRFSDTGKIFKVLNDDSQSFSAEADLTSLDSSGFTLNWSTNDATATEICYLALIPFASVDVRLADFRATAVPTGGVELEWRSESELDNLGFHLERADGRGGRTRVTPRLIAGSALWTTPGTVSSATRRYRFDDPNGRPGDRYWLIDHDLQGTTREHGPIVATRGAASVAVASAPTVGTSTSASFLSGSLPETASTPRQVTLPPIPDLDRRRELAERTGLSVEVDREGWISVTYDEWVDAGLPSLPFSRNLELTLEGRPVALSVLDGGDGVFGPGDRVEFYGLPLDRLTTDRAPYWLTFAPPTEKPERVLRSRTVASGAPAPDIRHSVTIRTEEQYFAGLRNGDTDNFFGPLLSSTPHTEFISIPHFTGASGGDTVLTVGLQGVGVGDHAVDVIVNGVTLGSCLLSGTEWTETTFLVPPLLVAPQLEIELATAANDSFVFLDFLTVTAPREPVLTGAQLRGEGDGGTPLLLSAVPTGVRVWDVTDPLAPLELPTTELPLPGTNDVALRADLPLGGVRTWLAVAPGGTTFPAETRALEPTTLLDQLRPADLWIVAPRAWLPSLQPLIDLRRSEGLSVVAWALEDGVAAFRNGVTSNPTRDALAYTRATTGELPRAVFLIGDATYDPRGRLVGSRPTILPTQLIESARLETASDLFFGDLDGDGWFEVPIGRLPAESADEVERYVARLVARTTPPAGTPFDALLVCDDDDSFSFRTVTHDAEAALPASASFTRVDRNLVPTNDARVQIADALDQGPDLVAYFGHGGTSGWAAEDLLTSTTVGNLGSPNRAPIVISTSCLNGFFHHRLDETLGEVWLDAPEGAGAVIASTAMTNPRFQSALGVAILDEFRQDPTLRVGEALRRAQGAADPHTVRATVLLGDPTLPLRR